MFTPYIRDIADNEPFVYHGGTLLKTGMAVKLDTTVPDGKFTKVTGAGVPTHIIMGEKSNGVYAAIRIQPTTVFEVPCSAAIATPGLAVQIDSDGAKVNASTGGAFMVEYTTNASGTKVRGRFLKEVTA